MAIRVGYGEEQLDEGGQKIHTPRTGDVTYSMVTTVNTAVWYTQHLLREQILRVLITGENSVFW